VADRRWRGRLDDLADRTVASPDSRAFAIRLALCMSVGEIARQHLPIQRSYWVLLTVAIVLKPDFGSVFARGVQRTVGTVIGVLLGALVLTVVPHNGWMLLPMAAVAGALAWAQRANYGLYVVFLTPLVLILLDFTVPGGLAWSRPGWSITSSAAGSSWSSATCCGRRPGGRPSTRRSATPPWPSTRSSRRLSPAATPSGAAPAAAPTGR